MYVLVFSQDMSADWKGIKEKHNHMTHNHYSFVKHLIFARNHDFHLYLIYKPAFSSEYLAKTAMFC